MLPPLKYGERCREFGDPAPSLERGEDAAFHRWVACASPAEDFFRCPLTIQGESSGILVVPLPWRDIGCARKMVTKILRG